MKALIIYWSGTGNTKKVAATIHDALGKAGVDVQLKKVSEAAEDDLYAYDLVFIGSPSYMWQPPPPVLKYVREKMDYYRERDAVKMGAPKVPGKRAVAFVTYSGPHTGLSEAVPVGKYLGQFFEHLGFEVAGEWYTVGEFHKDEAASTRGRLGDIRGRPNEEDLAIIRDNVQKLLA
jgi:flavodoxin